ncbi:HAD family hydrolase [Lichenicoccus roseus]|uniref:HAD family hydrolase n=1 Tax=Lichenicoccus roseus TaxID=2683649 RepID=UPI001981EE39|nr:HAD family phosphatase [Lichenicoccus roseus]
MTDGAGGPIAAIFDVDGVLLASPHERAWREALGGLADPALFTTALYQETVAGKPRAAGALASLQALGVADAAGQAPAYAIRKQARLEQLVQAGAVQAFPDAMRLVRTLRGLAWPMAVASSSKNAAAMLRAIVVEPGCSLFEMFAVDMCGRDLAHGKPDPEIFLLAAAGLGIEPRHCIVLEDAPAGIEAARAGGMSSIGVARLDDAAGLRAAQADMVVTRLDDGSVQALAARMLGGTV